MGLQRRVKLLRGTKDDGGGGYQVGGSSSEHDEDEEGGLLHLMICDLVLAFLWVLSIPAIVIISGGAWFGKAVMYVGTKFVFAWLGIVTEGGLYNPLSVLAASLSGGSLTTLLGRIPAQMVGSVLGVKLIVRIIPTYRGEPHLNVNVIVGIVMEGFLAFVAMIVNLLLKETEQGFFTATFISSITRVILCSFGGWLNPGSAFGWAYARGVHMTAEHLLVYWLAPFASTLFGSWVFDQLVHPEKHTTGFDGAVVRWKTD